MTAPRFSGRRGPGWSLGTRIALWSSTSTFLLVTMATVFLYWSLVRTLSVEDSLMLKDRAQTLLQLLTDSPGDSTRIRHRVEKEWTARKFERVFVKITDGRGAIVTETPGIEPEIEAGLFGESLGAPGATASASSLPPPRFIEIDGRHFRAQSLRVQLGGTPGEARLITLALDRTHEEDYLRSYRSRLAAVLAVTLVLSAIFGRRLARRGLGPINEITATVEKIGSTNLTSRLATGDVPVELESLVAGFNQMLERLSDSFDRLARFSADLAHELRTPINNLRGEIEVALGKPRSPEDYRDTLGSCLEECVRISAMIDSLLFLARAENPGQKLAKQEINVRRELEAVLEFYEAAAAEAGIDLSLDCSTGVTTLPAERTLFHRAIANLVSNSLKYTPKGGRVVVQAGPRGSGLVVAVADTGEGIPAAHLPRVFDRFYRVDPARSGTSGGTGLGLAIVKSIATIHGGSVEIESLPGRGTTVRLQFPG